MRIPAILFTCGLAMAAYTLNASSHDRLPDGWSLGGEAPKLYAAEVDRSASPDGQNAVILRRTEHSHPYGSAYLAKSIPVAPYAGKRVKMSMRVRFLGIEPGQAGIYFASEHGTYLHNFPSQTQWMLYETTLTLPVDVKRLDIGVYVKGKGKAEAGKIALTVIGETPPDQHMVFVYMPELGVREPGKDKQ